MEKLQKGHVYVTRMVSLQSHFLTYDDYTTTFDKEITNEKEYENVYDIYKEFPNGEEGFNKYVCLGSPIIPKEYCYIPVLLKYLGNGEFEEFSTGKKIIDYDVDSKIYESVTKLPKPFESFEEFVKFLPVLREYPVTIWTNNGFFLREVCDVDKIDYQKLPLDEMKRIILEVFDNASKEFQKSLENFIEKDYMAAKTEDLIRTFCKR